jgi:multiple sugar transport system ATP-binding protein
VADQGAGASLPITMRHVERLGDVSLLYVQVGDMLFTVRVEGSARPAVNTSMTLRLLPEHLHVFDAAGIACQRSVELPT